VGTSVPPRKQRGHYIAVVTKLHLSETDREQLEGGAGAAGRLAMRMVVALAQATGAPRLIDVTRAHVDGGLYHGRAGLDWAERLADAGARVAVPTTLNVGSLDLLHPHLYRGDAATAELARRLMDRYVAMGCRATWSCAPYQDLDRPRVGEHIAWAESNAIVFANSVLGARTNRYGDFIDICAAVTGRVPDTGLHTDGGRRARAVFDVRAVPRTLFEDDAGWAALGLVVGARSNGDVPAIDGLPPAPSEDALKALGAAAASSGSVALFHAIGITPEAPTLRDATGGRAATKDSVTGADLLDAVTTLTTTDDPRIAAVSVGTPHFSSREIARLQVLLDGERVHEGVDFYVSTSRATLERARADGSAGKLERAGVTFVVDTCTYVTPIISARGPVMTNSAKWAYYAPANIGVAVVYGTLAECVRSAVRGEVWRDRGFWRDS
jgi:predicted aconitase